LNGRWLLGGCSAVPLGTAQTTAGKKDVGYHIQLNQFVLP
jgi:hypothetical protein